MLAGEYALTRLAAAFIEYFLAEEALTRESLTLLTGTLRAQLAEVLAAAKKVDGEEAWRRNVVGPLRVTVGDLVAGIERRQRGLDAQQEEVEFPGFSGHPAGAFLWQPQRLQDSPRLDGYDGVPDYKMIQCNQKYQPERVRGFCRSFS